MNKIINSIRHPLTNDYPDRLRQQGLSMAFWGVLSAIFLVLSIYSVRNVWMWVLLALSLLMLWSSWRADSGKSIPVPIVPVFGFISDLVAESHDDYLVYKENEERASSKLGIVSLANNDEFDDYYDAEDERDRQRRKNANQERRRPRDDDEDGWLDI